MPSIPLALLTLLLGCSKIPDNIIEISTETQLREFAQQVNSGDDFSGKVVLKFTIAPHVEIKDFKDIGILSSTTGFPEFDETIKNMVYTWRWQKIDSGSYTITVPFEFGKLSNNNSK